MSGDYPTALGEGSRPTLSTLKLTMTSTGSQASRPEYDAKLLTGPRPTFCPGAYFCSASLRRSSQRGAVTATLPAYAGRPCTVRASAWAVVSEARGIRCALRDRAFMGTLRTAEL